MIRFPASEALAENCRVWLLFRADVTEDVNGDSNGESVDVGVVAVFGREGREIRREEKGRLRVARLVDCQLVFSSSK